MRREGRATRAVIRAYDDPHTPPARAGRPWASAALIRSNAAEEAIGPGPAARGPSLWPAYSAPASMARRPSDSSASFAARCSASFLFTPQAGPYGVPESSTSTWNIFLWSGPTSLTTR